ncbi:MAG: FAD-dependent oxidoreductase, partial [Sulfitobacter sp.]|nr:FAD-dependent oxidoreductase [Sulfitobacter sp.]
LPTLDPRNAQDALEATRFAFELSERCQLPVLLRPTTRVCHTRSTVKYGAIAKRPMPSFVRDPGSLLPVPANARRMRVEIEDRLKRAQAFVEQGSFFTAKGSGSVGVLSSGAPASTCEEILDRGELFDNITLLSLAAIYPLPEQGLLNALRKLDTVLVVEELSPYIEDHVRALLHLHNIPTQVLGKRTDHLPVMGEYTPAVIHAGLAKAFEVDVPIGEPTPLESLPGRPPILCASCPHRSAFFAVRSALPDDVLFFNDIGCYTLGVAPPLSTGDALLSMGSSLALAAGVARTTGARTVGFLGDSTFFHSGMPVLLNVIKENVPMIAVILDNSVTAMTGFQESPSATVNQGRLESNVDIEGIVRALGAKQVECVDPNDLAATIAAFQKAEEFDGLSVVIAERPCPMFTQKEGIEEEPEEQVVETYFVDAEKCAECGRSGCGHRCDLGIQLNVERSMVLARSLEGTPGAERPQIAPCAEACPLMLCVQGYATRIAAGEPGTAFEMILEELALPGSVCRVCDRPCESVCTKGSGERSVAINDLKRYAVDWAHSNDYQPKAPEREPESGKRVAIVGAGPAGLAAAYDLWVRGHDVKLFDAAEEAGGLLLSGIPEYRLPREVLREDVARLLAFGPEFEGGRRLGTNLHLDTLVDEYDGVLLTIGAGHSLGLDIPGEGPEQIGALDYLRDRPALEKGNSDCVVIGGGNSAIDAARVLLRSGADSVTLICLETRDHMPAIASEVSEAEAEGVILRCGMSVVEMVENGIHAVHVTSEDPTSRNPADFTATDGDIFFVKAVRVVLAIGQRPDRAALGEDLGWDGSWLGADATSGRTSRSTVFAAGDLIGGMGTVTGAMAAGRRAAWGLDTELRGAQLADGRMPPPIPPAGLTPGTPAPSCSPGKTRRHPPELNPAERATHFKEVIGTLSDEDARIEGARCEACGLCGNCRSCLDLFGCPAFLSVGHQAGIDPALCTACGVCAQFCPNGAIQPLVITKTKDDPA